MKPLKFIHITKTAGTSIEKIGSSHGLEWGMDHGEYGHWHKFFPDVDEVVKNKYDWFMVVRNPYDRIISEFYCIHGGKGMSSKISNKDPEFFNEYVKRRIRERSKTGDHWSEQYKYLDPKVNIHILKFENLKFEFEKLMKDYLLNIKLSRKTNCNPVSISKRVEISDMDSELIQLINEVYSQDFKEFGYQIISPE